MLNSLHRILMEAKEQTVTIKSLSFFLGLIVFGISLVFTITGMMKEIIRDEMALERAKQNLIDQKQDAKIDNLDTRLVHIERSRK